MQHRLFVTIIAMFMAFASFHTTAQEQAPGEFSEAQIKQTIVNLESETARKELIDQLEVMLESQRQADNHDTSVDELIGIEVQGGELLNKYKALLERWNISEGFIGNIIFLLGAVVLVLVIIYANKRLMQTADKKLDLVRRRANLSADRFSSLLGLEERLVRWLSILFLLYAIEDVLEPVLPNFITSINFQAALVPLLSILFVVLFFTALWEACNAFIEVVTGQRRGGNNTARIQTLLPIIRNVLLFTLVLLALLVALSEVGIDIVPLLAGAGVLGIAVGFGAQTLVKDFLTGFTVILEDLMQIGDVVRVADRTGVVEKITIRKIQLRDLDGTVHTVPFGEVAIVDNMTKEFSYYLMDIGVAYREDTDAVIECIKSIDESLREDEIFGKSILAPIEILGVNKFADSAVEIRARIKTKAHDKWFVGREFNRRMKQRFDNEEIEIPFPHQTIYFGIDKDGGAPPARVRLTSTRSPADDETVTDDKKTREEMHADSVSSASPTHTKSGRQGDAMQRDDGQDADTDA